MKTVTPGIVVGELAVMSALLLSYIWLWKDTFPGEFITQKVRRMSLCRVSSEYDGCRRGIGVCFEFGEVDCGFFESFFLRQRRSQPRMHSRIIRSHLERALE